MHRERRPLWRRLRLSTQILLLQIALIVLTLGAGVGISIQQARRQLDRQSGKQSLAIARTVAQMPEIVTALRKPPAADGSIQQVAERVRRSTHASFVVVANRQGIRY